MTYQHTDKSVFCARGLQYQKQHLSSGKLKDTLRNTTD